MRRAARVLDAVLPGRPNVSALRTECHLVVWAPLEGCVDRFEVEVGVHSPGRLVSAVAIAVAAPGQIHSAGRERPESRAGRHGRLIMEDVTERNGASRRSARLLLLPLIVTLADTDCERVSLYSNPTLIRSGTVVDGLFRSRRFHDIGEKGIF